MCAHAGGVEVRDGVGDGHLGVPDAFRDVLVRADRRTGRVEELHHVVGRGRVRPPRGQVRPAVAERHRRSGVLHERQFVGPGAEIGAAQRPHLRLVGSRRKRGGIDGELPLDHVADCRVGHRPRVAQFQVVAVGTGGRVPREVDRSVRVAGGPQVRYPEVPLGAGAGVARAFQRIEGCLPRGDEPEALAEREEGRLGGLRRRRVDQPVAHQFGGHLDGLLAEDHREEEGALVRLAQQVGGERAGRRGHAVLQRLGQVRPLCFDRDEHSHRRHVQGEERFAAAVQGEGVRAGEREHQVVVFQGDGRAQRELRRICRGHEVGQRPAVRVGAGQLVDRRDQLDEVLGELEARPVRDRELVHLGRRVGGVRERAALVSEHREVLVGGERAGQHRAAVGSLGHGDAGDRERHLEEVDAGCQREAGAGPESQRRTTAVQPSLRRWLRAGQLDEVEVDRVGQRARGRHLGVLVVGVLRHVEDGFPAERITQGDRDQGVDVEPVCRWGSVGEPERPARVGGAVEVVQLGAAAQRDVDERPGGGGSGDEVDEQRGEREVLGHRDGDQCRGAGQQYQLAVEAGAGVRVAGFRGAAQQRRSGQLDAGGRRLGGGAVAGRGGPGVDHLQLRLRQHDERQPGRRDVRPGAGDRRCQAGVGAREGDVEAELLAEDLAERDPADQVHLVPQGRPVTQQQGRVGGGAGQHDRVRDGDVGQLGGEDGLGGVGGVDERRQPDVVGASRRAQRADVGQHRTGAEVECRREVGAGRQRQGRTGHAGQRRRRAVLHGGGQLLRRRAGEVAERRTGEVAHDQVGLGDLDVPVGGGQGRAERAEREGRAERQGHRVPPRLVRLAVEVHHAVGDHVCSPPDRAVHDERRLGQVQVDHGGVEGHGGQPSGDRRPVLRAGRRTDAVDQGVDVDRGSPGRFDLSGQHGRRAGPADRQAQCDVDAGVAEPAGQHRPDRVAGAVDVDGAAQRRDGQRP